MSTATVRVIADPVFDCSDLIGKVFDDENRNGYQDEGEPGIPNVRIATVNGLLVTTDDFGRFHVACADIPDEERGSNLLMKLDERTLPTGYRITTENPRAVRMTRGKLTKLNFGAALHRVVRIDLMDAAFVSGDSKLVEGFEAELEKLTEHLRIGPSVIRISYQVSAEGKDIAEKRIARVKEILRKIWKDKKCCHEIMIEEEIIFPTSSKEQGGVR